MESRKWDELQMDCLVNVFGRVGVESLLFDIPLVCKSWYKVSLDPFCWKQLHFPFIPPYYYDRCRSQYRRQYRLKGKNSRTKFVKVAVDRSGGCATVVVLPDFYLSEALSYVADKCPALKKLALYSEESLFVLSLVIGKFKYLESLEIASDTQFTDLVIEIGAHCKNFVALTLDTEGECEAYIYDEDALIIVSCLPKIKRLALREVFIERETLITILKGCVELVHLDVCVCDYRGSGFDEDDEELSKLASHISTFECSGSVVFCKFRDYDFDVYVDDYGEYAF